MIASINNYIQRRLQEENIVEIPASQAARWLDEERILKDLKSSRGYALRRHLVAGNIFGAYQKASRQWFIKKVENYEVIISADDLRNLFGLKSRKSIYKKIKLNQIPAERKGKRGMYFRPSKLFKWALERKNMKVFEILKQHYGSVKSGE